MTQNSTITIELYLLCFNEEKMIRHTLNYYSEFCSKITIIDNQSTDDSMHLASTYKNVVFRCLDSGNEFVEDKLTASKNNCWKGSTADYVIVCDMDEFLFDENLQEKLVEAKEQNIIMPAVTGYNMMSDEFPANYKKRITEQVKHGVRSERFDKQIIFDPKKVKEINYRPGAHLCNPVFYENTHAASGIELKLLHYKYLGKDYVYKKHEVYVNRMSEISRKKKHGYEYLEGEAHVNNMFELAKSVKRIIK
ncbi:glycosyltransferase family 2 protein [Flavobacterium flavigenum]|uniref:glycosyltransferase family 2 protein n=1 Tax=Flavobacterium flavigenum TaxID=3003258 RepID=UPI0024832A78|nr:glycosyltransferase family 2 protein [Flavobacterium flavigenum]